jgi:hypothetical protein
VARILPEAAAKPVPARVCSRRASARLRSPSGSSFEDHAGIVHVVSVDGKLLEGRHFRVRQKSEPDVHRTEECAPRAQSLNPRPFLSNDSCRLGMANAPSSRTGATFNNSRRDVWANLRSFTVRRNSVGRRSGGAGGAAATDGVSGASERTTSEPALCASCDWGFSLSGLMFPESMITLRQVPPPWDSAEGRKLRQHTKLRHHTMSEYHVRSARTDSGQVITFESADWLVFCPFSGHTEGRSFPQSAGL